MQTEPNRGWRAFSGPARTTGCERMIRVAGERLPFPGLCQTVLSRIIVLFQGGDDGLVQKRLDIQ
jgi:hypothetical protein